MRLRRHRLTPYGLRGSGLDNVNPYSGVKILRDKHIVTKPYLFPIWTLTKESIYVIYETNSELGFN